MRSVVESNEDIISHSIKTILMFHMAAANNDFPSSFIC